MGDRGATEPARPSLARAHAEVMGVRLREAAQYRAAALAGVFTQVVFGFIIFMTLDAFSTGRPARSPMTRPQLVSYVWLGQAFLALLPWNLDRDVVQMLRTGAIAYELLRPLDLYTFEVFNAFTYGGKEAGQYPITLDAAWFRRFFTFAVPLALVSYFPVVFILGRVDPLGSTRGTQALAPLAGPLFLALSLGIFRLGVRRYVSAGF
jgi:ABC-type uncharacterized transport system permease subunit